MQPVRGQPLPRDMAGRDNNRPSRLPVRDIAWSQVQVLCQAPQAGLNKSNKVRRGPVAQLRQPLADTREKATCMRLACFESRFWPTRPQQVQCDGGRLAEAQRRCTEQTGWAAGALGESQGMGISSCSCDGRLACLKLFPSHSCSALLVPCKGVSALLYKQGT